MLVITDDASKADLVEALGHLSHRAGRVMVTHPDHAAIHAEIDQLLTALDPAPR